MHCIKINENTQRSKSLILIRVSIRSLELWARSHPGRRIWINSTHERNRLQKAAFKSDEEHSSFGGRLGSFQLSLSLTEVMNLSHLGMIYTILKIFPLKVL